MTSPVASAVLATNTVSPDWQLNFIAFLGIVYLILQIWDRLRTKEKTPPDHEIYATKKEMGEMEARVMESLDSATTERNLKFGELATKMESLTLSLQNGFQEIFFKLGVVEGQAGKPSPVSRRSRG